MYGICFHYVLKYIFGVLGRQKVFFCVTFNIYPSNYFLSIDAANSKFTVRRFPPKGRPENVLKLLCQCSSEFHFNWSLALISQVAFLLN